MYASLCANMYCSCVFVCLVWVFNKIHFCLTWLLCNSSQYVGTQMAFSGSMEVAGKRSPSRLRNFPSFFRWSLIHTFYLALHLRSTTTCVVSVGHLLMPAVPIASFRETTVLLFGANACTRSTSTASSSGSRARITAQCAAVTGSFGWRKLQTERKKVRQCIQNSFILQTIFTSVEGASR